MTAGLGLPAWLRWLLRLTALALGAMQAYAGRHYLNADGVSYLDLADAWAVADWQGGLSTYWGPLYPELLGGALALLRPKPYWEIAVVKLVGFGIFAACLFAFEALLRELLLWRRTRAEADSGPPDWPVTLIAYPLFLVATLHLISLELATPDLCVTFLLFLAAGVMTRNRRLGVSPARSAQLGLVLGLAYLAKAALLPIGAIFLAVSCLAAGTMRKLRLHLAVCGTIWLAIVGSYVAAMSTKVGRLTFGDARTLNCLWFVNGVELFRWRTSDPGLGKPIHPPLQLWDSPPLYVFAQVDEFGGLAQQVDKFGRSVVNGTYPIWFDPGYWCQGLVCRWTPAEQLRTLGTTGADLLRILVVDFGVGTATLLLLGLAARLSFRGQARARGGSFMLAYHLILPSVAAMGLYLLVHVQGRYVAPFLVLLALGFLVGYRFAPSPQWPRRQPVRLLVLLVWAPVLAMIVVFGVRASREMLQGEGPEAHPHWAVADYLEQHGIGPRGKVAVLGDAFECGWARLGRLRIVAQMEDVAGYRAADCRTRHALYSKFRSTGAMAVIAPEARELGEDWVPIPGTAFHMWLLR
jgi:hypothetical protein